MQDNSTSHREIRALTGLRFVAAFFVFVFHVHIHNGQPLTNVWWINNIFSQGAIGMTIFFMLSGFILAYTYAGRSFTLSEFYINRFARIYPVYVVAGLISLPWLASVLNEGVVGAVKVLMLLFANAFMIQAWFPQLFGYWNNGGAWSLSAEAFFYLTFPFALSGLVKLPKSGLWAALAAFYVLSVLPGAIYVIFTPRPTSPVQIFYALPIFRLSEFLFGAVLFLLSKHIPSILQASWVTIVSLVALFGYLAAAIGAALPIYVIHNWLVVPVFGLLLLALMDSRNALAKVLSTQLFRYAGEISYCFYSFQFVIIMGMVAYREYFPDSSLGVFSMTFVPLMIVSSLGYYCIEKPCREWLRGRVARGDNQPVHRVPTS